MMNGKQRQWIQIIAALTMLIDHVGAVFFPTVIGFRAIGRLSFPLFAFGIAQGVMYTHSFWRYLGRILLAAAVSQPLYWLLFGKNQANPLFMLAWGVAALYFWQKETAEGRLAAMVLLAASYWAKMSYGWYGVATIVVFGLYEKRQALCFYGQMGLTVLYGFMTGAWIQMISLFSFGVLQTAGRTEKTGFAFRLPRYFFYVFYPAHLFVLLAVKRIWG